VLTFHIAVIHLPRCRPFLWLKFETLSKVMAPNLNMTLHYAKITETKLISDVDVFKDNLEKKNQTQLMII
jgi:hypothetical protein